MPETFFTVWTNVFDRGRLQPGESFLVHGGARGIGTTAIQLARPSAPPCWRPPAVPRSAACEELGAARAIDYREEDFVAVARTPPAARAST